MIYWHVTDQCNISANVVVEITDSLIRNLKFDKASGPDDHSALIMYLRYYICSIFTHSFVPDHLRYGIGIPLLKDKSGNVNDMDNYNAITLLPVIYKVFGVIFWFM